MLDAILAQSRNTALIMGLIAMIGLLLQKKHATDVISGTMKTVIGFMVFNIGSSAMSGVVQTFTDLFNVAFGIEGVTTQVEVATGLALNTYGTEVALVMLLGFVVNLIVAKFTRFKAIFPYRTALSVLCMCYRTDFYCKWSADAAYGNRRWYPA